MEIKKSRKNEKWRKSRKEEEGIKQNQADLLFNQERHKKFLAPEALSLDPLPNIVSKNKKNKRSIT